MNFQSDTPQLPKARDYAPLSMALTMLGIPIYLYLPSFYAEHYGLSLTLIGIIMLITRSLDVITDPLIGQFSDRWAQKSSRFSLMLIAALGLIVSLKFLFFPTTASSTQLFVSISMVYLFWSVLQVNYMAISADYTLESTLISRLHSWREALGVGGLLFILVVPYSLELHPTETDFYHLFFLSFIVLLLLGLLFLYQLPKPCNRPQQRSNWHNIQSLRTKHPEAFQLFWPYFLNNLANAIPATLFIVFVQNYLQLEAQAGLFLIIYFVTGILVLPVWLALSRKLGRLQTWKLSMLVSSASFCLVFFLEPQDQNLYMIICILTGLSFAVDLALPASLQTSSVQSMQTKHSASGLMFGLWGLITKLSLAVAAALSLPAFEWIQNQLTADSNALLWLYAAPAICFKAFAIIWIQRILKHSTN